MFFHPANPSPTNSLFQPADMVAYQTRIALAFPVDTVPSKTMNIRLKMFRTLILLFGVLLLSTACSVGSAKKYNARGGMDAEYAGSSLAEKRLDLSEGRVLIKTATITVTSRDPHGTGRKVREIIEGSGGYVESVSENKRGRVSLTVRVPSADLEPVLDRVGALGRVTGRNVSIRDVTEQYADIEARLKNARALRDRLRELLKQAKNVADMVAIEAELSKAQSNLDSLEGRMKAMRSKVEMSSVHIWIEKQKVLGPLGLVVKGVAWIVEKLFILDR